jgi:hypothetical protein
VVILGVTDGRIVWKIVHLGKKAIAHCFVYKNPFCLFVQYCSHGGDTLSLYCCKRH